MYFLKLENIKKMYFNCILRAAVTLTHKCVIHLTCYHYRRRAYYLTAVVKRIDKDARRMIFIDRKNQILCSSDMINHQSFEQGLSSHLSWSQICSRAFWTAASEE